MRQRSEGGFTLLELAIVLFIVGLLAVGALKAASALRENVGISETSKRLDTLVMALQTFLMKNNRLPCPADPNIDTFLGDEKCPLNRSGEILRGVIPGRSLGLSSRLLDAWDRQFTYVVISEAASWEDSFASKRWPPTFELFRSIDNQLNQSKQLNQENEGIVVIISHGANGSGAYTTNGKQLPLPAATANNELENLDDDSTFVQAAYSTHEENPFDDQVLVLTEDQIVQPLANQGALQTKHAQTLEKLKRIENALIGFIVTHSRKECIQGGVLIPPADNQDGVPKDLLSFTKKDVYDPWGQPIQYNFEIDGTHEYNIGCYVGDYTFTFTLRSKGPNGTLDEPGSKNDDITIIKNKYELRTFLAAARINPNPEDPSADTDPPTAKK